jgi:hypothetical protein
MPKRVKVTVSGKLFDDDNWPEDDDKKDYSWTWNVPLEPGGAAVKKFGRDCVDNEVEVQVLLTLNVDGQGAVHVSGNLALYEGDECGQELEAQSSFGPESVAQGDDRVVYEGTIRDKQDDWATVKIWVKNPEI